MSLKKLPSVLYAGISTSNKMTDTEKEMELVRTALETVLGGGSLSEDKLYELAELKSPEAHNALMEGAARITAQFCPRKFDSCSIVNARSGHCSENCKWCAQSAHFRTGCQNYDIVDREEARRIARHNAGQGIGRFSLVASGRSVKGKALKEMAELLRIIKNEDGIETCASMGLLTPEEMAVLKESGIKRYHCNLETAPSYFSHLCTSHTIEDKLATIKAAKELGLAVCSGGIIGMGENRRQRMELAVTLRQVEPVSIPINILSPIPGTPLEHTEPISDEEILLTIAMFRFAHPHVELRFAGGRARLSRETQLKALKIGINGGVVGDLLTTIGSSVADDKNLVEEAGYSF